MLFTHSLTHIRIYTYITYKIIYLFRAMDIRICMYICIYIYIYMIHTYIGVQTRIIHKRNFSRFCLRGENYICRDIYIYIYIYMYVLYVHVHVCTYVIPPEERKKKY